MKTGRQAASPQTSRAPGCAPWAGRLRPAPAESWGVQSGTSPPTASPAPPRRGCPATPVDGPPFSLPSHRFGTSKSSRAQRLGVSEQGRHASCSREQTSRSQVTCYAGKWQLRCSPRLLAAPPRRAYLRTCCVWCSLRVRHGGARTNKG